MVRRSSLAIKLARLEIPENVYNWKVGYLLGKQHATKFASKLSGVASIWASVVQGPGVGPSEYDAYLSDLQPRNAINGFVTFWLIMTSDCSTNSRGCCEVFNIILTRAWRPTTTDSRKVNSWISCTTAKTVATCSTRHQLLMYRHTRDDAWLENKTVPWKLQKYY